MQKSKFYHEEILGNTNWGIFYKISSLYCSNCQGQPIKESWITSRLKDSKDP